MQDTRSIYENQLYFHKLAMNNLKNEVKKIIPLTISSKRIKCLGTHLTKEAQCLYTENHKIFSVKEIKA